MLYTAEQVAKLLGVIDRRVRQLAKSRKVGTKIGRDWVFTVADVEKLKIRIPGRPPSKKPPKHPPRGKSR